MTVARPHLAHESEGRRVPRSIGPAWRFVAAGAVAIAAMVVAAIAIGLPVVSVAAAGAAFGLALAVCAVALPHGHPHSRVGAANVITLARLAMVGLLLAILLTGGGWAPLVVTVSIVALSLDGLDGYLARRQRLVSRFGAAFDMEVDSAFALVLSVLAALGPAGPLALLLGLPRYLFGAAALALPWLNGQLPPRFSRKAVCVVQLIALIALQLPVLDPAAAMGIVLATLGLVAWSFAIDVVLLARSRQVR